MTTKKKTAAKVKSIGYAIFGDYATYKQVSSDPSRPVTQRSSSLLRDDPKRPHKQISSEWFEKVERRYRIFKITGVQHLLKIVKCFLMGKHKAKLKLIPSPHCTVSGFHLCFEFVIRYTSVIVYMKFRSRVLQ